MSVFGWESWDARSQPQMRDLVYMVPVFSIAFPVLRFFIDRFILEKLGKRFVIHRSRRLHVKFKESGWKLFYYTVAELFSIFVTYDEQWLTDTRSYLVGPEDDIWPHQRIKFKLKALYALAAGFYIYSIFALVFWETRRKDFGVSMTHHVATVVLIIVSYWSRLAPVGAVVLALHDASDVLLELAKMAKYSGAHILPDFLFGLFALSWLLLRLIYFPLWIIYTSMYLSTVQIDLQLHKHYGPFIYYVLNGLLLTLLVLHLYWWLLICRMINKQIQAGKLPDDVRSDSEEDEK